MVVRQIRYTLGLAHDRWRRRHDPIKFARSIGVTIGDGCRLVSLSPVTFGSEPYLVKLGNHVTVTGGVRFVTHDGGVWIFRQEFPDIELFKPIVVGDNVFIGANAIVLPGVTIGRDCVIGAGSVVSKSIPPGTIAAGCPARPLKTKEEYWNSIVLHATYTRTLTKAEKRRILTERLMTPSESLTIDQQFLNLALPEIDLSLMHSDIRTDANETSDLHELSSNVTT